MRAVAPRTGAVEQTIAEDQPEYQPITVALYQYMDGTKGILTRWKPNDAERAAIAAGEDIYVMQLNFGAPMVPLIVTVGPEGFTIPEGSNTG